jgi:Mn-dependent DtxR family transcriptional regulator
MDLTKSNEDYLEAIGLLARENGGEAQVRDIAAAMKVKMPSVTSAVRQLAELGLVEYVQYAPVRLTRKGARLADKIILTHTTLRSFFGDILQFDKKRADETACLVEHILKPEEIERVQQLTAFLNQNPELIKKCFSPAEEEATSEEQKDEK